MSYSFADRGNGEHTRRGVGAEAPGRLPARGSRPSGTADRRGAHRSATGRTVQRSRGPERETRRQRLVRRRGEDDARRGGALPGPRPRSPLFAAHRHVIAPDSFSSFSPRCTEILPFLSFTRNFSLLAFTLAFYIYFICEKLSFENARNQATNEIRSGPRSLTSLVKRARASDC